MFGFKVKLILTFPQDSSNSDQAKRGSDSDRKKLTGVEKKLQKKTQGGKPPTGSGLSEYTLYRRYVLFSP